jgi:SAM-dependent methyltransferase
VRWSDVKVKLGEAARLALWPLLANGQTVRWATERRVLRRLLPGRRMATAVDVGCGGGTYSLELLARRSDRVIAIDIDESLARLAQRRVQRRASDGSKVLVARARAEELPVRAGTADLVLMAQVLEHLEDPVEGLGECRRVLRDGGWLLVSVPHPPEIFRNPAHMVEGFTESELCAVLEQSGFRVQDRAYCMFWLTRLVIKLCHYCRFPLPLNLLCLLEQTLASRVRWQRPYCLAVLAQKVRLPARASRSDTEGSELLAPGACANIEGGQEQRWHEG